MLFHWANRDQHYVKTAEALRDYAFTVDALGGPHRVRFVLTSANLPLGNTKGEARYFFPLPKEAQWDAPNKTFMLPFHYRLPTEDEGEKYGHNSRLQEAVMRAAEKHILKAVPEEMLRTAMGTAADPQAEPPVSLLLKRLRHFARRQSSDYFVHRDLRGFLTRELEFYIKDQVLSLGDLEGDFESKRRTLRVIRTLAGELIEFLAQIEDVQRRLFEKRKFVLRTDYLAPLMSVPRDLWAEVVANKAQVQAWKNLFAVERNELFDRKAANLDFLEGHPTLVVDTRHFGAGFSERLLAAFDDLDDATDGLLIHSENYQALRLLERKHANRVECIHIDPPYNTQTSGFLYKNTYQHSSWLAMMDARVGCSRRLLSENGTFLCHIDENEYERLHMLMEQSRLLDAGTIVWDKRNPMNAGRGVARQHEYIICRSNKAKPIYLRNESVLAILKVAAGIVERHGGATDAAAREFAAWVNGNDELSGGERAYRYLDERGASIRALA